jgi:hypothetical protein
MTPDDRQLISGLFERMAAFGTPEKDREADALIRQSVQQNPDAVYMLVQSVLVQEHALQQADARIRDLEQRLEQAERAPAPASGGFLGGLFGGAPQHRPAASTMNRGGSVPSAGPRGPFGSGPMGAPARGPFGQQPQAAQGGGGSFLQSAMATAAGVAGGMLLANSISSLLGGGSSAKATESTADTQQASNEHNAQEDNDLQEASHDDDTWGDGDWGGGDFDI